MRVLQIDCLSGIAGDMFLAAMCDLGLPVERVQNAIDSIGLAARVVVTETKRKGFRAKHVAIEHAPEHAHRHLHHIDAMIRSGTGLSEGVRELTMKIFRRLGEAEARVHGSTLEKVHFHEVGAVDSIADILGAAVALEWLGADRIRCSPVPTGQGTITIAHGRVSVPAPATAELLKGIPLQHSEVRAELTTPTGAAILATVVDEFGPLPSMTLDAIGYGAGTKDFQEQGNLLRLMVGSVADGGTDQVWVIETNLDDVSAETIGFASERLFAAGALDVYCTPIQMKKNRPGTLVTVLCDPLRRPKLERILIRETGTLGVRSWIANRTKLERRAVRVATPLGEVAGKIAILEDGTEVFSPEFDDCRRIALERDLPLHQVDQEARRAYETQRRVEHGDGDA
ncbi:MAG TPA: nickel pincer cofactor biosynthesis protein LarC [Planctomycetaceae bacterium]|nr:nickel pincer cofactor biosynthesis protein LarC [Planctomycetaceae bacterium]